jgi:hypothetical protein
MVCGDVQEIAEWTDEAGAAACVSPRPDMDGGYSRTQSIPLCMGWRRLFRMRLRFWIMSCGMLGMK